MIDAISVLGGLTRVIFVIFGAVGIFVNKKLIHGLMISELYILKNKSDNSKRI